MPTPVQTGNGDPVGQWGLGADKPEGAVTAVGIGIRAFVPAVISTSSPHSWSTGARRRPLFRFGLLSEENVAGGTTLRNFLPVPGRHL